MDAAHFFRPEDIEQGEPEQELKTAAAEGRTRHDRWHVHKDGTRLWVHGTTTALRDGEGDLRGFARVVHDRTGQKRLEEELRQRAAELAEADRRKDEFLAMLAHELRNPLAPIRNAVQVITLLGPPDPHLAWAEGVVERQVRHLSRLIEDLLDVSRIMRGTLELRKRPVDLAVVVAQAVEMSRPLLDARRQELTVSLPAEPVRLEADRTRLAQVVANLLNNAVRYTPKRGHTWLTAAREGGEVILRVRDDGVGIEAAVLPRVFDLFAQASPSADGLGIGLTLVKRLVEMHGGTVQATSEGQGQGSEFAVRLPVLQETEAAPAEEAPRAGGVPAARRRILVVDDSRDTTESMALWLRLRGHEVSTAHDGPTALAAARAFRPEVVLLDIALLGGMSGLDLAPRLRGQPGLEGVLLVAVTGLGQEEDKGRAREAGFDAHLTKPCDLGELQRLLAVAGGVGPPVGAA